MKIQLLIGLNQDVQDAKGCSGYRSTILFNPDHPDSKTNHKFQDAKMLQSIEEVGMEKGMEKGMDIGVENTVMKLLRAQVLTKEQIADIIGLNMEKIETLEKKLNAESA